MPIRVAIVEDTSEVRKGIEYLLNSSDGFHCVSACSNAEEALEKLPSVEVDVVLMDIGLPGVSGIDCIRKLKQSIPNTEFMILSVFEDNERIFGAIKAGASGYLIKNTPPARILEAVRELYKGGAPMSNQIARKVLESIRPEQIESPELADLTKRERVVLENLAEGYLYKEIAGNLSISAHTVRSHVHSIYEKLHVSNRTGAIRKLHK